MLKKKGGGKNRLLVKFTCLNFFWVQKIKKGSNTKIKILSTYINTQYLHEHVFVGSIISDMVKKLLESISQMKITKVAQ